MEYAKKNPFESFFLRKFIETSDINMLTKLIPDEKLNF